MFPPLIRCCRMAGVGALLSALVTVCALAAEPKRVLILDPYGRDIAPFSVVASDFRETLARESGDAVEFYEISLDLARFSKPEEEGPFVEFLESRFNNRPVDLVAPLGSAATQFTARHRERLFPETPILVIGTPTRAVPPELERNTALVIHEVDLLGMVEDILQLQPQTTNIAVAFGASSIESFWVSECRREFQVFTNRVGFTWLDELPFDQILDRCSTLPPRSFILYALFVVDAAGVPFENHEALKRLHGVTAAPIFAYFESDLGLGSIGGRLYRDTEIGETAAHIAVRILRGERPESISPHVFEATVPAFDWRELRRWGIRERDLPPGSVIRFRTPTLWESYRWHILGVVLFFLVQSGLIVGLLINRATRRGAESVARELSGRLIRAHEEERARLGREMHDDLTQRIARLAIDAGQAERGAEAASAGLMRSIREGLVRLSEDIHALSYRLHPSVLEDLGLAEALKTECERFSQLESLPANVVLGELPEVVPQETALCLFRVAQEALRNAARHAQSHRVDVSIESRDGGLRLAVRDDGIGFDPSQRNSHPSLGLASMRERVSLLDGRLTIESAHGAGTTVAVWVPLPRRQ